MSKISEMMKIKTRNSPVTPPLPEPEAAICITKRRFSNPPTMMEGDVWGMYDSKLSDDQISVFTLDMPSGKNNFVEFLGLADNFGESNNGTSLLNGRV